MTKTEEDRIRAIEDTLLILPTELKAIKEGQEEIVEHLETINGTFGEFDDRLHTVETKWDYQEKNKEEKKENKKQLFNLSHLIIAGVAACPGIIILILALP